MQVIEKIPGHPWAHSRPTAEELLNPTMNIKWGMSIFCGMLQGANGDVWEALRGYSGFANSSIVEFWDKYGRKIQEVYKQWFNIRIPAPDAISPEPIELPEPLEPPEGKGFKVIKREEGSAIIVGDGEEVGVLIKLFYWDNIFITKTGTKLEYGDGGFELPYFHKTNATFEIEYKGIRSKIDVVREVPKTFIEYFELEEEPEIEPEPIPEPDNRYSKFLKPLKNTGRGIHLGEITVNKIENNLHHLKELGMVWAMLCAQSEENLGLAVEILEQEGIIGIARPFRKIDSSAAFGVIAPITHAKYIQIYNEPENEREWLYDMLPDIDPFIMFSQKWVNQAHGVQAAECFPGLQVTSTEDLKKMLQFIKEDDPMLLEDMWLSIHLYPIKRNGNVCPVDCMEHETCMLGFLKYAEVCKEEIGFVLPMIVTEGGWDDGAGTPEWRAEAMAEVFNWFLTGILSNGDPLPDYLFAICPWILYGRMDWGFSWTENSAQVPMCDAVKAMPKGM